MPQLSFIPNRRTTCATLLALMLQVGLHSGGAAQSESDFQLQTFRERDTDYGLSYTRMIWVVGTHRFGFIPPANWQISGSSEKKRLVFQHEGMKASMTMTVLPLSAIPAPADPSAAGLEIKVSASGSAPTMEQWRQMARETFPDSKVEAEWDRSSAPWDQLLQTLLAFSVRPPTIRTAAGSP